LPLFNMLHKPQRRQSSHRGDGGKHLEREADILHVRKVFGQ